MHPHEQISYGRHSALRVYVTLEDNIMTFESVWNFKTSSAVVAMESAVNSLQFNSALELFLQTVVLTHLSVHYSVCVIRAIQEDIRLQFPRATVTLALEEFNTSRSFEELLVSSINAGCEGFLVMEDALFPFLDSFRSAHEAAYFRASNKRIIVVTRLGESERKRLLQHDSMEVTPNILLVTPNVSAGTVELYTTQLSPAEPRGVSANLTLIDQISVKIGQGVLPDSVRIFPDKLSNMQGRRVRLSTLPYPPCAVANEVPLGQGNARSIGPANYSLQADGTEILMILELCRRHNCTLEIELVANSEWGQVYPNGSSDGLIGSLIDRRSDVAVAAIYRWYNWYKYVTMSAYTGRSGISCLVPRPRLLPFWQTPFLSFPANLWLMVCVSFCVGTTAVFITERARQYVRPPCGTSSAERYQLPDAIFFMLSLYVEQSVPLPNDMMAGTILLSFLLFGGFMVGNSYAGALASVMTIPRYEKSIDTRADFAASAMKWSGPTVAWMNSLLMAEQPELVAIRNRYEVHDDTTLARFSHTRRDMGYVHERLQYGSYALESFIDINATRLLQPLKEDVFWEQIITACSKTWPLMGFYDDLILRVQQNGILRYWELGSVIRNMGLEIQRNLADARVHDADHEPVKLLIAHFLGVFFILFVGLTLATVTFIVELVVSRTNAGIAGQPSVPIGTISVPSGTN
ncbi:glutamate receptor ionotropic, kainate 5-like [Anopheles marshallii]|uniref:glutamate receptor ionotropic, kainate 5-like n=1 Tax=Anopheles marshallii TaxID=1521116 RepID=UPI00237C408C|nr:glutamate receptor ionotropic, kainate 5-like [Anopheles marshallii]